MNADEQSEQLSPPPAQPQRVSRSIVEALRREATMEAPWRLGARKTHLLLMSPRVMLRMDFDELDDLGRVYGSVWIIWTKPVTIPGANGTKRVDFGPMAFDEVWKLTWFLANENARIVQVRGMHWGGPLERAALFVRCDGSDAMEICIRRDGNEFDFRLPEVVVLNTNLLAVEMRERPWADKLR